MPHVVEPVHGDTVKIDDEVFVVSHGWHTGIVIPATLIVSRIPELKHRFGNTRFIEFGWGDKGFYESTEITTGLTIQAIFWPTESVMHVVAVPQNPYSYFPDSQVEMICLNSNEYSSLARFIENSFSKDEHGHIIPTKNGIYGDSQFYKSVGDYYLMNTCNKWTAKALKSAGMDISTTFKLTAGSVMDFVVANNHTSSPGSCLIINTPE